MHVENITSNAMSLDRNGQSMLIQVYEKEIERLNNIINGLEKHLNQEIIEWQDANDLWTKAQVQEDRVVLNKLKELKEE